MATASGDSSSAVTDGASAMAASGVTSVPSASMSSEEARRAARKSRAVLCPLPETFLRIPVDVSDEGDEDPDQPVMKSDEERDREMALALQKQLNHQERAKFINENVVGRITITVVEAKLTKNYGVTRMDPYVRLRVGHNVYETPTCPNGAREPKWNKTVQCLMQTGIRTIDVEIYDECTFSQDSLIAYTTIPIPENVFKSGEICDEWWPLSGQEGDGKEGMLHLVLSLARAGAQEAGGVKSPPATAAAPVELPPQDLEEFSKMFPGIEKSVIQAVFKESRGSKEETVNMLLQMGQ